MVQTEVPSTRGALVFLVENFQTAVGSRERFELLQGIVGRAVVNANNFEIFVSLVQKEGEEAANGDARVKNRNDDRN